MLFIFHFLVLTVFTESLGAEGFGCCIPASFNGQSVCTDSEAAHGFSVLLIRDIQVAFILEVSLEF